MEPKKQAAGEVRIGVAYHDVFADMGLENFFERCVRLAHGTVLSKQENGTSVEATLMFKQEVDAELFLAAFYFNTPDSERPTVKTAKIVWEELCRKAVLESSAKLGIRLRELGTGMPLPAFNRIHIEGFAPSIFVKSAAASDFANMLLRAGFTVSMWPASQYEANNACPLNDETIDTICSAAYKYDIFQ